MRAYYIYIVYVFRYASFRARVFMRTSRPGLTAIFLETDNSMWAGNENKIEKLNKSNK